MILIAAILFFSRSFRFFVGTQQEREPRIATYQPRGPREVERIVEVERPVYVQGRMPIMFGTASAFMVLDSASILGWGHR